MSRSNISIPTELKLRMNEYQETHSVNWSFIASRAFENHMNGIDTDEQWIRKIVADELIRLLKNKK